MIKYITVDIAALNKNHYSQYKSFNEVGLLDMIDANALENKGNGDVIDWEAYHGKSQDVMHFP